jgi:hypothetical protein
MCVVCSLSPTHLQNLPPIEVVALELQGSIKRRLSREGRVPYSPTAKPAGSINNIFLEGHITKRNLM